MVLGRNKEWLAEAILAAEINTSVRQRAALSRQARSRIRARTILPRELEPHLVQHGWRERAVQLETDRIGKVDLHRVRAASPLLHVERAVRLARVSVVITRGKQIFRALVPVHLPQHRHRIVLPRNGTVLARVAQFRREKIHQTGVDPVRIILFRLREKLLVVAHEIEELVFVNRAAHRAAELLLRKTA